MVRKIPEKKVSSNRHKAVEPTNKRIQRGIEVLKSCDWGYHMVRELCDVFYPMDKIEQAGSGIGCACGLVSHAHDKNPVIVKATIYSLVGMAEALIHEIGHERLHILGIHMETHNGQWLENTSKDLYPSPVRFDKLRPMSAVLQAQYSYLLVTKFYNDLLGQALDLSSLPVLNEREVLFDARVDQLLNRNAYNLKRVQNGMEIIKTHVHPTEQGAPFIQEFLEMGEEIIQTGTKIYEHRVQDPTKYDYHSNQ